MNSLAISAVCMLYLVLTVHSRPVPDAQNPSPTAAAPGANGSAPEALGGVNGTAGPTAGSAPVASAPVASAATVLYNPGVGVGNRFAAQPGAAAEEAQRAAEQRQQRLDTTKLAAVREQLRALTALRPGYGPNRMAALINNLILATVQAIDALHGYSLPPPLQPQPYYGFNPPHNPYSRSMIPIEQAARLIIEAYLARHGYEQGRGTSVYGGTGGLEELLSKLDGHGYGQGWGTPVYGGTGRLGELIKLLILLKRGNPYLGQGQPGLLDRGWGNLGLGQAL